MDKGIQRIKAALVAQFLGPLPQFRVFAIMEIQLWGYERQVISWILEGFFLLEYNSERLANWIVNRSWNIHHSAQVLQIWEEGIQPMDFTPTKIPTWVILKVVPPSLITPDGISRLASLIGTPVNMFNRNGLDVKVCLLEPRLVVDVNELVVMTDVHREVWLNLEFPKAREYRKPRKVWRHKQNEDDWPSDGDDSKPPKGGEDIHEVVENGADIPEANLKNTETKNAVGKSANDAKTLVNTDKTPASSAKTQPISDIGENYLKAMILSLLLKGRKNLMGLLRLSWLEWGKATTLRSCMRCRGHLANKVLISNLRTKGRKHL
ncbi:hypothetical protein LINPERHAP1_LOCUS40960 [Linum perenne]